MPIAVNESGDAVFLTPQGTWETAQVAVNPQTKERLAYDGKDWQPIKPPANTDWSWGDVGMAGLRGIPIAGGVVEKTLSTPESQARYKEFDSEHPWISGGAKFAGGAAAMLPLAMTGPGGLMLGLGGRTILNQVGRSALSGTAIGGLDAATRGNDIKEGAQIGGGLGVAGPLVGRAIGSAIGGVQRVASPISRVPGNFETVGNVNVPITRGQATGDVIAQRYEESARKGVLGDAAKNLTTDFEGTQSDAINRAQSGIRGTMGGADVTALEAADVAQQGVQQQAKTAKSVASAKYDEAFGKQADINAGSFEGFGQKIKGDLTLAGEPIIISDKLTPAASEMIQHIDNGIGRLKVQNRADPFGQPSQENIASISLKGVEQARKELLSIARATTNAEDRRASRAIISAFDDRLQSTFEKGLYSGDVTALGTLKEARVLYSAYAQTFKSQGRGDVAGQIVEKMLGKHGQAATHDQIANYMYGSTKIGGGSMAPHVANKLKVILGEDSQEWKAVRQGLFSKLVDSVEGKIPDGPQKISQRIAEFLNGSGKQLSENVFDSKTRMLIAQYGALMKKLTPVPGAVNYSNSGYQIADMMKWTVNALAMVGGLHVAGPLGALAGGAANTVGKGVIANQHTRAVARHLFNPSSAPLYPAMDKPILTKGGALASRAILGM